MRADDGGISSSLLKFRDDDSFFFAVRSFVGLLVILSLMSAERNGAAESGKVK